MKFNILIPLLFFYSLQLHSNEKAKTSNTDLRSEQVLLTILDDQGNFYKLYQGLADDYFFDTKIKSLNERLKISNIVADEFDKFYVSKFIQLKYSFPEFQGKNCSKSFSLSMRGETQVICQSESEKKLVMNELLNKLKNILKK